FSKRALEKKSPSVTLARKEFGTYFIGYSRSPRTIEEMLQNMFVGKPPGNYDRLLDFQQGGHRGTSSSCHPRHFWRMLRSARRIGEKVTWLRSEPSPVHSTPPVSS